MSQVANSGGSSNDSAKISIKAKLRIKALKFDNSDFIKGYPKTLMGWCEARGAECFYYVAYAPTYPESGWKGGRCRFGMGRV